MIALLISAALLLVPPAQRHHEAALAAYSAHRYDRAVALWLEADREQPSWKYALNLAKAYYALKTSERAWHWALTASQRGLAPATPEDRERHRQIVSDSERSLLRRGALLFLKISPALPDRLEVRLDDVIWEPPRVRHIQADSSWLTVRVDGRLVHRQRWSHPRGTRVDRAMSVPDVVQRSAWSELRRHRRLRLSTLPVLPEIPEAPTDHWRWTALGTGLALVGVGTGLFVHSHLLDGRLADLNQEALAGDITPESYAARYDSLRDTQRWAHPAGVGLLAVGGASLIAAVTLFVLAPADTEVGVFPSADGVRFFSRVRF